MTKHFSLGHWWLPRPPKQKARTILLEGAGLLETGELATTWDELTLHHPAMMKVWPLCRTASSPPQPRPLCFPLQQDLLCSHLRPDLLCSHLHMVHLHNQSGGPAWLNNCRSNVPKSFAGSTLGCFWMKDVVTLLHLALLPLQRRQLEQKLLYLLVVPQFLLISLQLTAMKANENLEYKW